MAVDPALVSFAKTVRHVFLLQEQYFKTRDRLILVKAKQAEKLCKEKLFKILAEHRKETGNDD